MTLFVNPSSRMGLPEGAAPVHVVKSTRDALATRTEPESPRLFLPTAYCPKHQGHPLYLCVRLAEHLMCPECFGEAGVERGYDPEQLFLDERLPDGVTLLRRWQAILAPWCAVDFIPCYWAPPINQWRSVWEPGAAIGYAWTWWLVEGPDPSMGETKVLAEFAPGDTIQAPGDTPEDDGLERNPD